MFTRYDDNLARHIYLRTLQDINEALFYKLVTDHLEEMLPIVCTPTIARLSLYTAIGPGPGQPARVFTGATGRPERDRGSMRADIVPGGVCPDRDRSTHPYQQAICGP